MSKTFKFVSLNVRGSLLFIMAFLALKSLTFVTPLLLVNALLLDDFVQFDSGLALSNILVIFVNFGVSAAVPLYLLKEKREKDLCYIYYHSIFFSILMIIFSLVFSFYLDNDKWTFICIVVSILCNARVLSSHNKSRSNPIIAAFFESYVYIVFFFSLIVHFFFKELSLSTINLHLLFSSFFILSCSIFELCKVKSKPVYISLINFKYLYSFTGLSLIVSISVVSIITLVRAFGSEILTNEQFLFYSVYFRFFSISIIFFQFYSTLKFKSLYESSHQYLDEIFSKVALSILLFVCALFFASDYIVPLLFTMEAQSLLYSNWSLTTPILLVMPLWVVSALLENVVSRERVFLNMLSTLMVMTLVIFSITIFLYYCDVLSFSKILYIHVILLSLLILSQLFALNKLSFKFMRIRMFALFNFILGMLGASLLS